MIQSTQNFVRMLILIISTSNMKLGHVVLKYRSLGEIIEKTCLNSRGHIFYPKVMILCQNINPYEIKVKSESGTCWV